MSFVGPIRSKDLNDLVRALLGAAGADSNDARLVAEQVVEAEARENSGQGLIRLRPYINWMRTGKVVSPAKLKIEREFGAALLLREAVRVLLFVNHFKRVHLTPYDEEPPLIAQPFAPPTLGDEGGGTRLPEESLWRRRLAAGRARACESGVRMAQLSRHCPQIASASLRWSFKQPHLRFRTLNLAQR